MRLHFLHIVLSFCSIIGFGTLCKGQQEVYYTLDESDGLPSNYIYRVFEDSKGYIWIATEEGAARFDGHTMKVYNTSNGLANNDVYKIFEDECDRIWFMTMSNDLGFILNDSLYRVKTGIEARLSDFFIDSLATRFLGGEIASRMLTVPCSYPSSPSVLTDGGLGVPISIGNDRYLSFEDADLSYSDSSGLPIGKLPFKAMRSTVNSYGDGLGILNLKGVNRLAVVDTRKDILYLHDIATDTVESDTYILVNRNERTKTFQLIQQDSLVVYDSAFREIQKIAILQLSDVPISSYYLDSGDNLWVCTNEEIRLFSPRATYYNVKAIQLEGRSPSLSKVLYHEGRLNLITETGSVFIYNLLDGSNEQVYFGGRQKKNVYDALIVRNDLWLSTQGEGTIQILDMTDQSKYTSAGIGTFRDNCSLVSRLLYCKGFHVENARYLICGGVRLKAFDLQEMSVNTLSDKDIFAVSFKDGQLWAAESDTVNVYSDPYDCDTDSESLIFSSCDFMFRTKSSMLLSNQQGYLLECHGIDCDTIAKLDGGSAVKAVTTDSQVLLSTKTHLYRYRVSLSGSELSEVLDYAMLGPDVLVRDFVLVDSTIYYATNKGLMSSEYKKPLVADVSLDLYLDSHNKEKYFYSYDHEPIRIEFSTSYLSDFDPVVFEYKLQGLNSQYVEVEDRTVTFPKLPHGSYTFLLRARLENGEELDSVKVKLLVEPPWWNTYWFYVLSALFIVSALYGMLKYILIRSERKAALNQQFAELELNALQSQMSPHFMFNTMNSLQNLVTAGRTADADKYISKFASVLRKYLELSKSKFITLAEEIEVTKLYLDLETLRFGDRFSFSINNELTAQEYQHLVPATLVQPFVENALIHGLFHKEGSGNLTLNLFASEKSIHIEIIDDGIGRAKANELKSQRTVSHKSRGQQIVEDRLNLIRKIDKFQIDCEIIDLIEGQTGSGTKVSIVIQVNSKYGGSNR